MNHGDTTLCARCAHSCFDDPKSKYRRCRESGHALSADVSLCREVRKEGAACGPDGTLWEAVT